MKKLKVTTVVGTRPEIIRLSRVIAKLDTHCEHVLVHTGQNYDFELNEIFFKDLDIRKPDFFLDAAEATSAETIGNVIIRTDRLLAQTSPDAFLVLGDTNSCLALLAAKRRRIPTFHMEAGNRCFDMRVPEEINRRIVDHAADVNLTYSNIARDHLLREGLPPDLVIKTGSPMSEVLTYYAEQIASSEILTALGLEPSGFLVVSAHREENIECDRQFIRLVDVLNSVASRYDMPVVVSTHPRTRRKIDELGCRFDGRVRLLKPLGFLDYIRLQTAALVVLSDSGTITEEASILNFRALNLRETHERPEGMEEAAVMMVGLDTMRVMQGLDVLTSQPNGVTRLIRLPPDYAVPNVSDKVVRILHSYTDYVRRTVWKEY